MTTFHGFKKETLEFLSNLAENNNKTWFENHRREYEIYLLNPFKDLVTELGDFMQSMDPDLEIRPSVNKTISRIYRDTRFSKDKSPFRSNMWLMFKRPVQDWKDAPGFFFELFPDWYRYGMGFYSASTESMRLFRSRIDDKPKDFEKIISFYDAGKTYTLHGEDYKRSFDVSHPEKISEWYRKKSFYLSSDCKIDKRLFSGDLVNDLIRDFSLLIPLYQFLWELRIKSIDF
jgi:uncharacterized protein (TIGR02453 family)